MKIVIQITIILILFTNSLFAQFDWEYYEETNISGTVSGSVKHGHIFKTLSGNIYEITDYVYLYEYEYSPSVIVLKSGDIYKLIIDGFDETLLCRKLNSNGVDKEVESKKETPKAFEAFILNDFDGYEQGNIYVLSNGQIWEQTEPYIWIWIWVMPKVLIYETNGIYKMKFDQIDHSVTVKRIK